MWGRNPTATNAAIIHTIGSTPPSLIPQHFNDLPHTLMSANEAKLSKVPPWLWTDIAYTVNVDVRRGWSRVYQTGGSFKHRLNHPVEKFGIWPDMLFLPFLFSPINFLTQPDCSIWESLLHLDYSFLSICHYTGFDNPNNTLVPRWFHTLYPTWLYLLPHHNDTEAHTD